MPPSGYLVSTKEGAVIRGSVLVCYWQIEHLTQKVAKSALVRTSAFPLLFSNFHGTNTVVARIRDTLTLC